MNLFELEWTISPSSGRAGRPPILKSQKLTCPNGLVVVVYKNIDDDGHYCIYTVNNEAKVKPVHLVDAEPIMAQAVLYDLMRPVDEPG